MTQATQVQLPSGEAITTEDIVTGFLLLARYEAEFPVITSREAKAAVLMLALATLEYNDEHEII